MAGVDAVVHLAWGFNPPATGTTYVGAHCHPGCRPSGGHPRAGVPAEGINQAVATIRSARTTAEDAADELATRGAQL